MAQGSLAGLPWAMSHEPSIIDNRLINELLGSKVTKAQKEQLFKDLNFWSCNMSKFQSRKVLKFQSSKVPKFQSAKFPKFQSFKVLEFPKFQFTTFENWKVETVLSSIFNVWDSEIPKKFIIRFGIGMFLCFWSSLQKIREPGSSNSQKISHFQKIPSIDRKSYE